MRRQHRNDDVTAPPPGFFVSTGMPDPGWWEALWPDPAKVLHDVGVVSGTDVSPYH
jgi:hypothetical protein